LRSIGKGANRSRLGRQFGSRLQFSRSQKPKSGRSLAAARRRRRVGAQEVALFQRVKLAQPRG
jgi:hypothetical protein